MKYWGLRCPCGETGLRVSGRPRAALGQGSYFWRQVSRVWREARVPLADGEPTESPFLLPLWFRCEACGREEAVLIRESAPVGVGDEDLSERLRDAEEKPRESYRCRDCRRGVVEVALGVSFFPAPAPAPAPVGTPALGSHPPESSKVLAAEVVTRCKRCHREARLAWFDERPTMQEQALDLLYGRR